MKKVLSYLSCLILFAFSACENKPTPTNIVSCTKAVIIDTELYTSGPNDTHIIESISIDGQLLEVTYLGGCDRFEMNFVASELVNLALPPIYEARFSFRDSSTCEALTKQSECFDIADLTEEKPAILVIKDWPETFQIN